MPRLSITLTDSQAQALDLIAAETGATKQSMIGLAITSWIRANDHLTADSANTPEIASQEPEDTKCEVCGNPANWTSYDHIGQEHYFCDKHGMSDLHLSIPIDLVEDSVQAAEYHRFCRDNPEISWDVAF